MLGIATIKPNAVLYNATEMPCASWIGFEPAAVCEPKISIMPTTVPNRPSNGDIAGIVPSVVRKRSRSWATRWPTSSIASFITGRGLFTLASPAARTRPSGPFCAVLARSSDAALACFRSLRTLSTMPTGATTLWRNDHSRSRISAKAMTDAKISGQIGQPAAWMIDHTTRVLRRRKACTLAWRLSFGKPSWPTTRATACRENASRRPECSNPGSGRTSRACGPTFFALTPAARAVPILGQRRGDRRADQHDEPRHVDPEQKQGQDGERPVDDLVRWKVRDVEMKPVLGGLECAGRQQPSEQRDLERHSTRGNQRVDQRKPRGIDQKRGRFAQHRERLGADGRRPDRMLDDPIRVVNRRTDERRPGGEPERIDNDAARQRSRLARTPD